MVIGGHRQETQTPAIGHQGDLWAGVLRTSPVVGWKQSSGLDHVFCDSAGFIDISGMCFSDGIFADQAATISVVDGHRRTFPSVFDVKSTRGLPTHLPCLRL